MVKIRLTDYRKKKKKGEIKKMKWGKKKYKLLYACILENKTSARQ